VAVSVIYFLYPQMFVDFDFYMIIYLIKKLNFKKNKYILELHYIIKHIFDFL
jgi:hypothetical protein